MLSTVHGKGHASLERNIPGPYGLSTVPFSLSVAGHDVIRTNPLPLVAEAARLHRPPQAQARAQSRILNYTIHSARGDWHPVNTVLFRFSRNHLRYDVLVLYPFFPSSLIHYVHFSPDVFLPLRHSLRLRRCLHRIVLYSLGSTACADILFDSMVALLHYYMVCTGMG